MASQRRLRLQERQREQERQQAIQEREAAERAARRAASRAHGGHSHAEQEAAYVLRTGRRGSARGGGYRGAVGGGAFGKPRAPDAGGGGGGAGAPYRPWLDAQEGAFHPINLRYSGERCCVCDADTGACGRLLHTVGAAQACACALAGGSATLAAAHCHRPCLHS